jgi:hypothetical protein
MSTEIPPRPLRPLTDVWLRPRKVFRSLANTPVGPLDYVLGALQGIVSWLAFCRTESLGQHAGVGELLGEALLVGPVAGILGILLMCAIYRRLGRVVGGTAGRNQVSHVLSYGGVPLVASLGLWLLTAAVAGSAAFMQQPPTTPEPLAALLLSVQPVVHLALIGWSLLLQVMGFAEVEGLALRRAVGVWIAGQLLVLIAVVVVGVALFGQELAPRG